jgi:vacuolar-type H+-ATPase subunit I/STV1
MPFKQQLFALFVSLGVFLFTIELVRKKRLREEYSVLWLGTSFVMFVLIIKYDWLVLLTNKIGAVLPTTTLFLGSIIFLVLLAVQFSIKISKLTGQVKDLVQENALLRHEFEKSRERK